MGRGVERGGGGDLPLRVGYVQLIKVDIREEVHLLSHSTAQHEGEIQVYNLPQDH